VTGLAYNVIKKAAQDLKTFDVEEEPPPPPDEPPPPPPRKVQSARAKGNLLGLFSSDDYPSSAERNQEEGTTTVRLSIGPDGRVSGCDITGSSGSAALDQATCNVLRRRARFNPANDTNGNPVADTYTQRVTWRLPEE
jgi:periplasmic protein TonB